MKRLLYLFPFLLVILVACESYVDTAPYEKLRISLVYAYSSSKTVGEANVVLSQFSNNVDEVGVVWATKSNPTIADNRQSVNHIDLVENYTLLMNNLVEGTTYYIRAYFTFQGVTIYSTDEIAFTQNHNPDWVHLPSPSIELNHYVLSSGGVYSYRSNSIIFYSVNKTTNIAKNIYFYPDVEGWDLKYYNKEYEDGKPMRFEPFKADFVFSSTKISLVGGGYNKQFGGKKFFLKDFRLEGLGGYLWSPSYPGKDVTTTTFGVGGNPYVLENTSKGVLWRYNTQVFQWEAMNTVPLAKEAKFISFDTGTRAFILPESDNWNDDLDPLYEYLPTNQWKAITTFKGENRRRGLSFTYNGKLYYGAGQSTKTLKGLRDIWEYNPTTNIWRQIATYPGSGTLNLITLIIGGNLYIGFGQQVIPNENQGESFTDVGDFWRFTIR
jgi:hypothetical protein